MSKNNLCETHQHQALSFYPYISYQYKAVPPKITQCTHRAEIWWVGSWHEVDMINTPFRGGQTHQGDEGGGEWRLHRPSPIPYYNPMTARATEHYLGRKGPWHQSVFHLPNPDRYCACAQHTFAVSQTCTLLGRVSPTLGHWTTNVQQTFTTSHIFGHKCACTVKIYYMPSS